ncbi:MAG: DNA/RNA nuclease SfsA [Bacteroidales bacterium]|nr:DNA/RNA nuclease SfsA [Bacteroidales bacterium]
MKFSNDLVHGRLIKRYKRFLADVELDNGDVVTAHCTNSGSMKTALEKGAEVYMTYHGDPKRKTQFTWEMIKINGDWVGINTNHPNLLAYEAIRDGVLDKLKGYTHVQREVKTGQSRIDVYAENEKEKCFVEVKNVTMKQGDYAVFPDAVTKRGQKHLDELIKIRERGLRAVMFYVIQRSDVQYFSPARDIDPDYAKKLEEAYGIGVEVFAVHAQVSPKEISITRELPFVLKRQA